MISEQEFDSWKTNSERVKLESGKKTVIVITKWHKEMKEIKDNKTNVTKTLPFIVADVLELNGQVVKKKFSEASSRLCELLKPVLMKAQQNNKELIKIEITAMGEGFGRQFLVNELPM